MGVQAQTSELLQHEVDSPDLKGIDQLLAEKQDLDVMIKRGVDPVDMNKRDSSSPASSRRCHRVTLYYLGLQVTAGVCFGYTVAVIYKLIRAEVQRIRAAARMREELSELYQVEEVTE